MYYKAVEQAATQGEVLGKYLVHILQTTPSFAEVRYGFRYNLIRFLVSLELKYMFILQGSLGMIFLNV